MLNVVVYPGGPASRNDDTTYTMVSISSHMGNELHFRIDSDYSVTKFINLLDQEIFEDVNIIDKR